ncbi:DUF2510 domain-containing protein [Nocardioides sp.]|uniref:DUF2510 domain-containing protein n=1 Tax=Nocardioides sp. TaxID=35761 RepID=UPI003518C578
MAIRGWYPDPAGQPGLYRYWDGDAWTHDLTADPATPLPGTAPPPPDPGKPATSTFDEPTRYPGAPADPAVPQWTPMLPPQPVAPAAPPAPPPTPPWPTAPQTAPTPPAWTPGPPLLPTSGGAPAGGRGNAVVLVVGAVLLVLAVGVGSFLVVRALTGDDAEGAGAAPTPSADTSIVPRPSPTPDDGPPPTAPDPATCVAGAPTLGSTGIRGGRITGGGLSTPLPDDYALSDAGTPLDQAAAFTFADAVTAPSKVVATSETSGWVATVALGGLSRVGEFGPDAGVTSAQLAAEQVFACAINSPTLYTSVESIGAQTSEATTVDGVAAWSVSGEVRVDEPELGIEGDLMRIVVVDLGEDRPWGMFLSVAPLGQDAELATQQALVEGLGVD